MKIEIKSVFGSIFFEYEKDGDFDKLEDGEIYCPVCGCNIGLFDEECPICNCIL